MSETKGDSLIFFYAFFHKGLSFFVFITSFKLSFFKKEK